MRNDLITSTAAIAALASVLEGVLANLPIGMAPGLGLNAYVSSNCKFMDSISAYLTHLVYIFHRWLPWFGRHHLPRSSSGGISGRVCVPSHRLLTLLTSSVRWIFLALSLLGIRQWLVRIMPQSLVLGIGSGIGLFIAYVIPPLFRSTSSHYGIMYIG